MSLMSSCSRGSSPLARGLHWRDDEDIVRPVDHPRSRGVYAGAVAVPAGAVGSSPLARGLHGVIEAREAVLGIIPARAGFTRCWPASWGTHPDHPRSRGVYGTS